MGQGDSPRPEDKKRYDLNYERVFGRKEVKVWEDAPRFTEGGEPIGGPTDEVIQGAGEQSDSEAPQQVEGARCPNCTEGIIVQDTMFTNALMCNRCRSNWRKP